MPLHSKVVPHNLTPVESHFNVLKVDSAVDVTSVSLRYIEKNTPNSQEKKRKMVMVESEGDLKSPKIKILTTRYPLNNSSTKKIAVGLQYIEKKKSLKPAIALLNSHYSQGLLMESDTWTNIRNYFPDSYFKSDGNCFSIPFLK